MATKTRTFAGLQSAYARWHKGGITLGRIKKTTGYKVRELAPAFYVLGTTSEQRILNTSKGLASAQVAVTPTKRPATKKAPTSTTAPAATTNGAASN